MDTFLSRRINGFFLDYGLIFWNGQCQNETKWTEQNSKGKPPTTAPSFCNHRADNTKQKLKKEVPSMFPASNRQI